MPSPPDKPESPARGTYPLGTEAPTGGRKTAPEGLTRPMGSAPVDLTNPDPVPAPGRAALRPIKAPRKRTGPPRAKGTRKARVKAPVERWGLVRVKVGRERYAKTNIERQHMRAWYPRIAFKPGKLEALFPGYVFVLIDGPWHFLKSTYGVVAVVTTGGEPSRVPPRLMRQLIRDQGKQGYIETRPDTPKRRKLKPGDPATITMGTFKNLKAEYISLRPGDRVRVLLEFMGKAQRIELPAEAVIFDHDATGNPGPIKAKRTAVARQQSTK